MTRILAAVACTLIAIAGSTAVSTAETAVAIFAGGCFWCVESDFDHVPGVTDTLSGYTGGTIENPTYENHNGHREAVKITFDPAKVSYEHLLQVFWHSVDPTDDGGQFCDRGHSYTTAIYAAGEDQLEQAKASKEALDKAGALSDPIVTPIEMANTFWPAENYHQNYYKVNPVRYTYYRFACGRDARIEELWGKDAFFGIEKH